jgi:hypothetical protein
MPEARRLEAAAERRNSGVATFLQERHGYQPLVAFEKRVQLRPDLDGPLPGPAKARPQYPVTSETGQLRFDPERKRFLIEADRAAAVIGFIGTEEVSAGPIARELAASARGFTCTLVTSLDSDPIARSRRLLVSHPGYTLRTQPGSDPPRPQQIVTYPGTRDWFTLEAEPGFGKPSGNLNGGSVPIWMERVEATLTIRTQAKSLRVWPLSGKGERLTPIAAAVVDGGFRVPLQAEGQALSPWFEIEAG